jgi:hypothetical protein
LVTPQPPLSSSIISLHYLRIPMTFTNMSKPTTVPIETSGGSCRFKRLKLYARTITKSGKEKRNVCQSSFSAVYVTNNYYRLLLRLRLKPTQGRPKKRFVTRTRHLRCTNLVSRSNLGEANLTANQNFSSSCLRKSRITSMSL